MPILRHSHLSDRFLDKGHWIFISFSEIYINVDFSDFSGDFLM